MNFPEIRALYDLGAANHGVPEAELTAAEARLHQQLPAVLRGYYAELGAHELLNRTQDKLLHPLELHLSAMGTHLVFYAENQWTCTWGLTLANLALPDPPVWRSYDDGTPQAAVPTWQPEAPALSRFLLAMAHQQALFAWPYAAHALEINSETEARVRANWPVLPVALAAWGATYFQATPGHLLALFRGVSDPQLPADLFVAAKTRADFTDLLTQFAVEWAYNSLEDEE